MLDNFASMHQLVTGMLTGWKKKWIRPLCRCYIRDMLLVGSYSWSGYNDVENNLHVHRLVHNQSVYCLNANRKPCTRQLRCNTAWTICTIPLVLWFPLYRPRIILIWMIQTFGIIPQEQTDILENKTCNSRSHFLVGKSELCILSYAVITLHCVPL